MIKMNGLLDPELETDIDTLLECLQCQNTSESIKKTLMTLTSILMSTEYCRYYFRECHGLEVVNTLLRKTRDPVVVQTCLFCLATAAEKTVATQRVLAQAGTFQFLHKLLESAEQSTAKMVAYYINSLVLNNGNGQQMSFTSGCLSGLIDVLKSHLSRPSPEDVQLFLPILTTAIGACVNNPQNEKNQSHCSLLIPHSLRHIAQSEDLDLVNRLLALLGFVVESNMSMQERLRQCGGMEVLLARLKQSLQMASSPEQLEICVALVSTLNFAITSNADNVEHFVKGGGLEALCKLLEDASLDHTQQLTIVVTLATVMELSVEGRELLSHSQDQAVLVHLLMETQADDVVKSLKYILFMCNQSGTMDSQNIVSEVEAAKSEINMVSGLIEKLKGLQEKKSKAMAQPGRTVPALPASRDVQVPAESFSSNFTLPFLSSNTHLLGAQQSHPKAILPRPSSSAPGSTALSDSAVAHNWPGAAPACMNVQMPAAFSSSTIFHALPPANTHPQGAQQQSHLSVGSRPTISTHAGPVTQNQHGGAPLGGEASNFQCLRPAMPSHGQQGNLAPPPFSRNPGETQQSCPLVGTRPSSCIPAIPVHEYTGAQSLQGGAPLGREQGNFQHPEPSMPSWEQQGYAAPLPCNRCSGAQQSHPSLEVKQASPFPGNAPVPVSGEPQCSLTGAPWGQAPSHPQSRRPMMPSCAQHGYPPPPLPPSPAVPKGVAVNVPRSQNLFQPIHPASKETSSSSTQVPPVQPQFRVPQPPQQTGRSSAFCRPSPVVQARLGHLFQSSPSPARQWGKQSQTTPRRSASDEMVGNLKARIGSNQTHLEMTAQHSPWQRSSGELPGHQPYQSVSNTPTRICSRNDLQLKATPCKHQEFPHPIQSHSLNPHTPTSFFRSQQQQSGQAWGAGNQNNSAIVPAHPGAGSGSASAPEGRGARQLQAAGSQPRLHAGARQNGGLQPAMNVDLTHAKKVVSPQSRNPASSFAVDRLCDDEYLGEVPPPTSDYNSEGRHPYTLPTRPDRSEISSVEEQVVPLKGQKFSDSSRTLTTLGRTRSLTSSYEASTSQLREAADAALGRDGKQQSASHKPQTETFKRPKQLASGNKLETGHACCDCTFAKPQSGPRRRKSAGRSCAGTPCSEALSAVPARAASSEARASAEMEVHSGPVCPRRGDVSSSAEWSATGRKTSKDKRDASPKSNTTSSDNDGKVWQDSRSRGKKGSKKTSAAVTSSPAKSESCYNLRSSARVQPDKFSAKELDGHKGPFSATVLETSGTGRNAVKSAKESQSARKAPNQSRQPVSECGSAAARLIFSPYDFSDSDNSLSSTEDQFPHIPVSIGISSPACRHEYSLAGVPPSGSLGSLSTAGPRKVTGKCPGCSSSGQLNSRTYNVALETCPFTCSSHRAVRLQERRFIRACHRQRLSSCAPPSVPGCPGKMPTAKGRHKAGKEAAKAGQQGVQIEGNKAGQQGVEIEGNKAGSMGSPAASRPKRAASSVMGWKSQTVPGSAQRRQRVPYSAEELDNLKAGVARFGRRWGQILATYAFHPSRTAVDLMEKCKRLKQQQQNSSQPSTPAVPSPSPRASQPSNPFSLCEERRLRRGVQNFGYSWTTILHVYSFARGRVADDLRQQWRQMNKRRSATRR